MTANPISIPHRDSQDLFQQVSIVDIFSCPSPIPKMVWGGIPFGHVTLLGAHGGAGKSMFALQLSVAVSLGLDFLGVKTEKARVLFFSGEDNTHVLRNRLKFITQKFHADPQEIAKNLMVLDASESPSLYCEIIKYGISNGNNTKSFSELKEVVNNHKPSLIVLDNASDVFDADENNRVSVRKFMRSLKNLIPKNLTLEPDPPAILLLAHIQKQAVRSKYGENYSGSTAWHNSARSRFSLVPDENADLKLSLTTLTLTHEKFNLGQKLSEPLSLKRDENGLLELNNATKYGEESEENKYNDF